MQVKSSDGNGSNDGSKSVRLPPEVKVVQGSEQPTVWSGIVGDSVNNVSRMRPVAAAKQDTVTKQAAARPATVEVQPKSSTAVPTKG
jgi:hypothetical protein